MKTLSPLKAIRRFCVACQGGSFKAIEECAFKACPLYALRSGEPVPGVSRIKSIRAYCLACVGTWAEVETCAAGEPFMDNPPCPLFVFRKGTNPNYSDQTRLQRSTRAKGIFSTPCQMPVEPVGTTKKP